MITIDFFQWGRGTREAAGIVTRHAPMTDLQFFEREIEKWKRSPERLMALTGERYYNGQHDILRRKRTVIGQDGEPREVTNLPNNKLVDNQYAIAADKKTNYLAGKPLTFDTGQDEKDETVSAYEKHLKEIFNARFHRLFWGVAYDSINGCRGWLYLYYNDQNELAFRRFRPWEVLPFWKDSDKTELDCALHIYEVEGYEGQQEITREFVELLRPEGMEFYELRDGKLVPDASRPGAPYVTRGGKAFSWGKIPLISFRGSHKEQTLIERVKGLQDAVNTITSDFLNNMQEDARNTILVLVNYDGTEPGEFRRNLAQYGVVKVKTTDGVAGDVKTLAIEVDSNNYLNILKVLKNAIVENARSFDAKDERMAGNPNQMNIQSMYSDIDLDANGMETEFQASFEELLWFVNAHLAGTGKGDFSGVPVNVIFNRDILINETEAIEGCAKSEGIISHRTIVSQHPWVKDVEKELERLEREKEEARGEYDAYRQDFAAAKGRLNGEEE